MSQQETFEALREILPQLESKLRHNIEQEYQQEYQQELQKVQAFYKKYADDIITKRQQEIRREAQSTETHLRRQLSLIQRERQQWLTLQQSYRKTIFELTEKLSKNENDLSNITEIMHQNIITEPEKTDFQVSSWKKKSKFEANTNPQFKASRKDTQNSIINANNTLKQSNIDYMNQYNEERPLRQSESRKKWKIGEKQNNNDNQCRGKRQDTLVLSPPKMQQQGKGMKSSLLIPPQSIQQKSSSSIFWNEQGKKKFLSMIRSIK